MKILILGAGVIGVTSAWYLAADGHEVTLIDRAAAPGMETSFANGGQISASHAEPWASAETPAISNPNGKEGRMRRNPNCKDDRDARPM